MLNPTLKLFSLWKPFQIKYQALLLIEGNSEKQGLFPAYQRSWAAASLHRLQGNTQTFARRSKPTPASSQDLLLALFIRVLKDSIAWRPRPSLGLQTLLDLFLSTQACICDRGWGEGRRSGREWRVQGGLENAEWAQ